MSDIVNKDPRTHKEIHKLYFDKETTINEQKKFLDILLSLGDSPHYLLRDLLTTNIIYDELNFQSRIDILIKAGAEPAALQIVAAHNMTNSTMDMLLSHGMKTHVIWSALFQEEDFEKQKSLVEYAITHKESDFDFNKIRFGIGNYSINFLNYLICEKNISPQDLLSVVANQSYHVSESSCSELTEFLISKGADLLKVQHLSKVFIESNPKLMATYKENKEFLLKKMIPDDLEVDPLVLKLMQSIYVENTKGNDYLKDLSSKLNYELHKVITESHLIRQLLSYVTDNSDVGIYIDSTSCDEDTNGHYNRYAAKKIAINSSQENITRTINHELTHQAIDLFFKNFCHPFSKDDLATKKALKALIDSNIDKGDYNWFSSIYFNYEENKYDIELFTWLVSLLTEKILNPEKTIYDSQGFTEKVWEEFQKIVKLMMEKDGKEFVPEPAPEVYEFSQESQETLASGFIGEALTWLSENPAAALQNSLLIGDDDPSTD